MRAAHSCLWSLLLFTLLMKCEGRRRRGKLGQKRGEDFSSGVAGLRCMEWGRDPRTEPDPDPEPEPEPNYGDIFDSPDADEEFLGDEKSVAVEKNVEDTQMPNCTCVDLENCDLEDRIITTGEVSAEWRFQIPGKCPDNQVCCIRPLNLPKEPEESENSTEFKGHLGCGRKNTIHDFMLTPAAGVAEYGEFPWTLRLMGPMEDDLLHDDFHCGASLVHPRLALTAAHCLVKTTPEQLIVRAGEWDTSNNHESQPHQDRSVLKIILHPEFDSHYPKNDIGLLVLEDPFDMTENVNVVCLPMPGDAWDFSRCVAVGWGQTTVDGPYSNVLKKIDLSVVANDDCQAALRKTRLGKWFILDDSFICADGRNDTCLGDGGSPLICPLTKSPEVFVQIGIVSWGIKCGRTGLPGVYVNVENFLEWIDKQSQIEDIL